MCKKCYFFLVFEPIKEIVHLDGEGVWCADLLALWGQLYIVRLCVRAVDIALYAGVLVAFTLTIVIFVLLVIDIKGDEDVVLQAGLHGVIGKDIGLHLAAVDTTVAREIEENGFIDLFGIGQTFFVIVLDFALCNWHRWRKG